MKRIDNILIKLTLLIILPLSYSALLPSCSSDERGSKGWQVNEQLADMPTLMSDAGAQRDAERPSEDMRVTAPLCTEGWEMATPDFVSLEDGSGFVRTFPKHEDECGVYQVQMFIGKENLPHTTNMVSRMCNKCDTPKVFNMGHLTQAQSNDPVGFVFEPAYQNRFFAPFVGVRSPGSNINVIECFFYLTGPALNFTVRRLALEPGQYVQDNTSGFDFLQDKNGERGRAINYGLIMEVLKEWTYGVSASRLPNPKPYGERPVDFEAELSGVLYWPRLHDVDLERDDKIFSHGSACQLENIEYTHIVLPRNHKFKNPQDAFSKQEVGPLNLPDEVSKTIKNRP